VAYRDNEFSLLALSACLPAEGMAGKRQAGTPPLVANKIEVVRCDTQLLAAG